LNGREILEIKTGVSSAGRHNDCLGEDIPEFGHGAHIIRAYVHMAPRREAITQMLEQFSNQDERRKEEDWYFPK